MALGNYAGAAEVYFNGRLLAELSNFRRSVRNNLQEVETMQKGLAGFSSGAHRVEASADTAIPKAGFERDFEQVVLGEQTVRIVHILAGKRFQYEGKLMSLDVEQSTNSAASASWQFIGRPVATL